MDREEGIRIIAYNIWEEEGCKCHGSDVEHWLKAETIWRERNKPGKTEAEMEPSISSQLINNTSKTRLAAVPGTHQGKKGKSSKRKP